MSSAQVFVGWMCLPIISLALTMQMAKTKDRQPASVACGGGLILHQGNVAGSALNVRQYRFAFLIRQQQEG
jgi:hypothetical protein